MSLPAWLARSIYRAQEAAMHRPTFAMLAEIERTLAEIERTQWCSREGIEAVQAQQLNRLLAAAWAHSPWHAARLRAGGLEEAVQSGTVTLADLARLPTMNKRDARDNVEQ
ncbi:MAG: putative capK protein, partial [Proteobacteria bacterium]|nr:putative capK protein [Pseudomonadota bacterium]